MNKYITPYGLGLVRKKRDELNIERARRIKELQDARAHGDLSENAEYTAAREKLNAVDELLTDYSNAINDHTVFHAPSDTSFVRFGATVVLKDEETNEETQFRIGSEIEARLDKEKLNSEVQAYSDKGILYFGADLPKSVIGKSIGNVINYKGRTYKIIDLKYSDNKSNA